MSLPFHAAIALATVVLHEGHAHGADAGGVEWSMMLVGILAVGTIGVGSWYVYRNHLPSE